MKDYYTNDSGFYVGQRVKAFDSIEWGIKGDAENNDIFMKPGTIVAIELEGLGKDPISHPRLLASVQFDHTNRPRGGYFLYGLEKI